MYTWIRVSGISMSNGFDICAGEEFLRLISFIFVRLIIQFRDRPLSTVFKLLTVHPIFLYICFHDPSIPYAIQLFYIVPPASHRIIPHTRDDATFYISFHLYRTFTPRSINFDTCTPLSSPMTFVDAIFIIPFLSIPLILRFTFYHTV